MDAQRVILTADPAARPTWSSATPARRCAWAPPAEAPPIQPVGPVRTVSVPWSRRAAALAELLQLLDPASVTIWAHDRSSAADIARAVPVDGETIRLVTGDAPKSGLIIAFDLPSHERLSQLVLAGEIVLLVPPGHRGLRRRHRASGARAPAPGPARGACGHFRGRSGAHPCRARVERRSGGAARAGPALRAA